MIEIKNAVRYTQKSGSRNEFYETSIFYAYVCILYTKMKEKPMTGYGMYFLKAATNRRTKNMPQNKRESFIYSVMMCFTMVLWMSIYNVALHMGVLNFDTICAAWLGFPIAYVFAFCCDWFLVSGIAKGFAFRFLVKPDSSVMRKVICISSCMVVPMVIIMSMYGALEGCVKSGNWSLLFIIWLTNIPKNFIMALPFQLLIAGPLVRKVFRSLFPVGKVLA